MSIVPGEDGDVASILDEFQKQMRVIAEAQDKRRKLVGTATSRDRMVSVSVNADGVVIETKFSAAIKNVSCERLAKMVTKVAQDAAADVARKNSELAAPIVDRRARLPKLSELIDGVPDFAGEMPVEAPVSLAAPRSGERAQAEGDAAVTRFTDVEKFDHDGHRARSRVTDFGR
ncbi:YbaB/EbfC family nucleoid-associated protein [Nocardia sp. NBC_00881]|uniref:YbaB/EbfC family nucleoid-associated protein n=1 Tax=Nocardia sp. NBC_00881 TaxID=2975995 RepID=UPI0038630F4A|nr:YbaB/EbfC family nucleoid-associated protein [Nocardia sp. NBC_00881]